EVEGADGGDGDRGDIEGDVAADTIMSFDAWLEVHILSGILSPRDTYLALSNPQVYISSILTVLR
ncbi:hypothetical protein ACFL6U_20760, partial [Planctomycetota bacterium]